MPAHPHPICSKCGSVLLSGQGGAVIRIVRVPRRARRQRWIACLECLDRIVESISTRPELLIAIDNR